MLPFLRHAVSLRTLLYLPNVEETVVLAVEANLAAV
jgi:hypothetical protein